MRRYLFLLTVIAVSLAVAACGGSDDNKGGIFQRDTSGPTAIPLTPSVVQTRVIQTLQAGPTAGPRPSPTVSNANREDWQAAMLDSSKSLPGEYVAPHPGADGTVCDTKDCTNRHDDRNHINGTVPICTQAQLTSRSFSNPLCYNSNPPTSGPHAATWVEPGVYTEAVAKERLVHSMEHADVVIWYNTTDPKVIQTLAQLTNGANNARKLVVMSPYSGMEANTIALTAWTRLDKFPVSQMQEKRVLDFINAHSKRFNPEGF